MWKEWQSGKIHKNFRLIKYILDEISYKILVYCLPERSAYNELWIYPSVMQFVLVFNGNVLDMILTYLKS